MILNNLKKINSPLIEHYFSIIRNKNTNLIDFKFALVKISQLIINEISKDFELKNIKIETPLSETETKIIKNKIILVPILRAGLSMLEAFQNTIPFALIGHAGFYRKKNFKVEKYYFKIPKHNQNDEILILDIMIATGNTIVSVLKELKKETKAKITIVSLICHKEGIENIYKNFQNIKIFTVKVDPVLNSKKYIVPGLGDAGDRFFGT